MPIVYCEGAIEAKPTRFELTSKLGEFLLQQETEYKGKRYHIIGILTRAQKTKIDSLIGDTELDFVRKSLEEQTSRKDRNMREHRADLIGYCLVGKSQDDHYMLTAPIKQIDFE